MAIRGAGATVLSSALSVGVQIIATVVLARMLAPADFGVVAMVTTFSLLLTNFGLNGFTEAILQRDEMDHSLASNIFWITVGVGLFFTLTFCAGSSLLVRFYHTPLVRPVAMGVSLSILITSASVVHLALLKRAMLFSRASANDVFSRVASVGVSIVFAWAGFGYWALVAGIIAQALSLSIGAWLLCRWVPGRPRAAVGTGAMVRFAGNVYAHFTFNYFARNTDNMLVGWRFGAQSLGFYKKAYDLFALTMAQTTAPLTNVAVSGLSRFKPTSIQYRQALLNALAVTAFVGMAIGADLTLVGQDVIRVVLGAKWAEAGRLFTYFGPGIGIMLLYTTNGWIHLSIGKADRWFRWGIVEYAFTALMLVLGLHWGPGGVALAWTISFWIMTIPALWYAVKPIDLPILTVIGVLWRYAAASLLAGAASALVIENVSFLAIRPGPLAAFERIVMVSTLFLPLYLAAVILLHGGFGPLNLIGRLLREMIPNVKFPGRSMLESLGRKVAASVTPQGESA